MGREDDIKAVDVSIDNGASWRPAVSSANRRATHAGFAFEFEAPGRSPIDPVTRHRLQGKVQPAVAMETPATCGPVRPVRIEVK